MIPYEHLSLDTVSDAGTLTAVYDLLNGPQYANARYTPAVAPRRTSSLAGQSAYADVEDSLTVDVLGSTAATATRNAEALLSVVAQAGEWTEGENVEAVQVRVRAQGSTVGDLTAIMLGPAPGTPPASLAAVYDVPAGGGQACWIIRDVELRFLRRGRWLRPRATSAEGATLGNPAVSVLTFTTPTGPTSSPAGVQIVSSAALTANPARTSFLLYSGDVDGLYLLDATLGVTGSGFTNVADAAALPFNGTNVRRYTPVNTQVRATAIGAGSIAGNGYQLWAMFAVMRNNSASVSFFVQGNLTQNAGATAGTTGQRVVVPAGATNPIIYPLGIIPIRGSSATANVTVALAVQAESIAGGPTLDISHVALIALDNPDAGALAFPDEVGVTTFHVLSAEVQNAARTGYVAETGVVFDESLPGIPYRGDIEISTQGSDLYATYLRAEETFWTIDNGAGAKASLTLTAYRRTAYLTPQ